MILCSLNLGLETILAFFFISKFLATSALLWCLDSRCKNRSLDRNCKDISTGDFYMDDRANFYHLSRFLSRDPAFTGSVGSADPPDFLKLYYENQGPREDHKSGGSETSNLPEICPSNPKIRFLLHFYTTISKSQGGQLTPLTPCSRGPCLFQS